MIGFTSAQRYFLCVKPADMRKSFDGLCGLVRSQMGRDLMTGDVFIFVNRRRDRLKLLTWDRTGFVIWYKRLEAGTLSLGPAVSGIGSREVKWEDLVMALEGIRPESVRRKKRYSHVIQEDRKRSKMLKS